MSTFEITISVRRAAGEGWPIAAERLGAPLAGLTVPAGAAGGGG